MTAPVSWKPRGSHVRIFPSSANLTAGSWSRKMKGEIEATRFGVALWVIGPVSPAIGSVAAHQEIGRGKFTNMPAGGPLGNAFDATTDGPAGSMDMWFSLVLQEADARPQCARCLRACADMRAP